MVIAAAARFGARKRREERAETTFLPPVSLLKPWYGAEPIPTPNSDTNYRQGMLPCGWGHNKNTAKQLYLPQTDGKLASNPCHVDDHIMKQALLIVDVQPSFPISMEILHGIRVLSAILPSVATVERHDESVTPFEGQLGWKPGKADESLIPANLVFIKHGYLPPPAAIEYLRGLRMDRILVCSAQADTCVLAAGFALFDDLTGNGDQTRSGG